MVALIRRTIRRTVRRAIFVGATAAAAIAAACLSTPAYQAAPLVSYREDATGTTVSANGFDLHFAGGSGFHFPDRLMIGGGDVLGRDPAPLCFDQSETGFLIFPAPRISSDGDAPRITNQLTAPLRGPAVVQIALDWSTRLCTVNRTPGGTTTFTVFPDGRILRRERVTDPNPNQQSVSSSDCQCREPLAAKGSFIVSSYWSFARASFTKLSGLGSDRDPAKPVPLMAPPAGSNTSNYDTVCFDRPDGAFQVVSAWIDAAGDSPVLFGRDALLSHDLQKPISVALDASWDIHGALFVERGGCIAGFRRAIDYTNPPELIADGMHILPSALDGIYGGDTGNGQRGIAVTAGKIALSGQLKSGFAVWLVFEAAVELPRATRAGATGAWYVPQRVDDRNWILWFDKPLADGETITVEPD